MSGKGNGNARPDKPEPLNRFYKEASLSAPADGVCTVLLDGRPVRTPARQTLSAPEAVAGRIARESGRSAAAHATTERARIGVKSPCGALDA